MKKKYFLILFLVLIALPLITSQTYQAAQELNLKVPFEVNGSIASALATCNISIYYPDGSYLKENVSMTNRNNGDFNITLLIGETNNLGLHEWRVFCCDGARCAVGYGDFEVTTTGKPPISILQNQILIIFMFLAIILLVLGFYLNFASFGFIGSLMFLLSGIYTMIYGMNNIANLYTRGIAISLIGLGLIFMYFSVYEWMFENSDEDY